MSDIRPEQVEMIEGQVVDLTNVELNGRILDIGGGGEGIIGELFGERVIAIDKLKDELEEAPAGPLKVVMDARRLGFLDNAFEAATAFFAMMYMPNADHESVMTELHRVLKPGGLLCIWDVAIPAERPPDKQALVVQPTIKLPGGIKRPGYGVRWTGRQQDAGYFTRLAGRVGFELVDELVSDRVFSLRFRKKTKNKE